MSDRGKHKLSTACNAVRRVFPLESRQSLTAGSAGHAKSLAMAPKVRLASDAARILYHANGLLSMADQQKHDVNNDGWMTDRLCSIQLQLRSIPSALTSLRLRGGVLRCRS